MNQTDKLPLSELDQTLLSVIVEKRKEAAYSWKDLPDQEAEKLLKKLAKDKVDIEGHVASNAKRSLQELQERINRKKKIKNFFQKTIHFFKNCL